MTEKVVQITKWAREHAHSRQLKFPKIFWDASGINGMRTVGCDCCSSYMSEEIDDTHSIWNNEEQLYIVKEAIKGLIEGYGLKLEDLK